MRQAIQKLPSAIILQHFWQLTGPGLVSTSDACNNSCCVTFGSTEGGMDCGGKVPVRSIEELQEFLGNCNEVEEVQVEADEDTDPEAGKEVREKAEEKAEAATEA